MTKQFTTPCFIRKNTHELRAKLKEIGYCIRALSGTTALATINDRVYGYYLDVLVPEDIIGFVDCGENEALFLALAAMNDIDFSKAWFVYKNKMYNYETCNPNIKEKINDGWCRPATVPEIIEHFKTKEK